ncbi:hypothetical protein TcWFU_009533 [Taenia crassiceps]|uniref:Uncharacterized protein n=1 Tax=Taenia crassiceps TaxID=6207 RepID=A0ABR4QN29_9CEST
MCLYPSTIRKVERLRSRRSIATDSNATLNDHYQPQAARLGEGETRRATRLGLAQNWTSGSSHKLLHILMTVTAGGYIPDSRLWTLDSEAASFVPHLPPCPSKLCPTEHIVTGTQTNAKTTTLRSRLAFLAIIVCSLNPPYSCTTVMWKAKIGRLPTKSADPVTNSRRAKRGVRWLFDFLTTATNVPQTAAMASNANTLPIGLHGNEVSRQASAGGCSVISAALVCHE